MKETLREVRGLIKEDATTSYPPKEINKKKKRKRIIKSDSNQYIKQILTTFQG